MIGKMFLCFLMALGVEMWLNVNVYLKFFAFSPLHAVLLWLLTAACIKTGRPQMAKRAIELAAESRLLKDGWPEYYDGKLGRFAGKQARKHGPLPVTWSPA
jgi:hypothetical protein